MSQLPPDPYGSPPPPPPYGQQPPPGYAQQPNYAPPGGYPPGPYAPAARTSGAAIASLVLGLPPIMCVPFVTGLLAIIFGVVGLRATKTPAVRGRGLAVAGLVLGIVSVVVWTAYFAFAGAMAFALFHGGLNPMIARGFFQQMSAGNAQGARAMCVPGTPLADVQATVDQMKPYGPMTTFNTTTTRTVNGVSTLDGTAGFAAGSSHPFHVVVGKGTGSPVPQVQSWDLK